MGPSKVGEERRSFLIAAIYGLWGLIAATFAVPAAVYLLLPPRLRVREDWAEAGDAAKLPQGKPVELIFRQNRIDGWKLTSEKTTAWAVKLSETEVVAFAPQCTHLGCAYHWDAPKHQFLCPCHTSTFSVEGKVLSGPAPRPLDRYSVRLEGGKLMLGPIVESAETAG